MHGIRCVGPGRVDFGRNVLGWATPSLYVPFSISTPPARLRQTLSTVTTLVFSTIGVASITFGWLGYKKANSKASLSAGCASGVLLLAAAALTTFGNVSAGLILGGVTCTALAARFVPAYFRTRKVMPAGVMSVLAMCGVAATVFGFLRVY
jgi:uncharacterized membrane protein (UPF0136 family)